LSLHQTDGPAYPISVPQFATRVFIVKPRLDKREMSLVQED
jgi:hypothetical protein